MPADWWPGYHQRTGRQPTCIDASWWPERLHQSAKTSVHLCGQSPEVGRVKGLEWVKNYEQYQLHRVGMVRALKTIWLRRRRNGIRWVTHGCIAIYSVRSPVVHLISYPWVRLGSGIFAQDFRWCMYALCKPVHSAYCWLYQNNVIYLLSVEVIRTYYYFPYYRFYYSTCQEVSSF